MQPLTVRESAALFVNRFALPISPEAAAYLEAAYRLGEVPSENVVYEDVLYAIETAKKANFYMVAVYDTESTDHWERICRLADRTITFH